MKIKNIIAIAILIVFASNVKADVLGNLGKFLEENKSVSDVASIITGTSSPSVSQMTGTWKSAGPAVNFKSKEALNNIGGAITAAAIKKQLVPYYQKAHLENLTITITSDSKFTIKAPVGNITGVITKNKDNSFTMKFNVFNKINIGSIKTNIQYTNNKLDITFDIKKLVDLVSKIATQIDNKSIATITSLIQSYDGVYVGFEFSKTR